jgi:hypothetical protein
VEREASMKNITITLDEDTAGWARLRAASRGISVSRLIRELLQSQMRRDADYEEAMRRYFATAPRCLRGPGERYPTREEIYDRPVLRR